MNDDDASGKRGDSFDEHLMRFDEAAPVEFAVVLLMSEPCGDGIHRREARVLAVSRRNVTDDFGIPGGRIEPGETPAEAAVRELKEETGIKAKPWEMHFVFDRKSRRGAWTRVFTAGFTIKAFNVTYYTIPPTKQSMDGPDPEILVAWKTPAEMVKYPSFGDFNRALFAFMHIPIGEQ